MFENNLLDGIIYIAGVSLVFFMIPTALMFGITQLICKRIENAPRKVAR